MSANPDWPVLPNGEQLVPTPVGWMPASMTGPVGTVLHPSADALAWYAVHGLDYPRAP